MMSRRGYKIPIHNDAMAGPHKSGAPSFTVNRP
jgi:hypothetical protein